MPRLEKYTKEILKEAIESSDNLSEALRKIGANPSGNTRQHIKAKLIDFNISTEHFTYKNYAVSNKKLSPQRFLIKNEPLVRTKGSDLKNAMLDFGIDYKCAEEACENPKPLWAGKPLNLQVDHINGDYTDNLIENLRFLCPNCHSQTETHGYKGKPYIPTICLDCDNHIQPSSKRCVTCANRHKAKGVVAEKSSYPETSVLIEGIEEFGYLRYSKELGLSDNGLRKLLRRRGVENLPRKKSSSKI